MLYRNAHDHDVPEHLWDVANRVHQLVLRDGVLDRWHSRITEWLEQQAVTPGLDEERYVRSPSRPAGEYAPLDFELRIEEKYAILGAVHDFAASGGTVLIGQHDESDQMTPAGVAYCVLRVTVAEYSKVEADFLLRFLVDVQADLGVSAAENEAVAGGATVVEPMAEHYRRLRDFVATYDANQTRRTVPNSDIVHTLHTGHECEQLIIELLRDSFTWDDEHKLDESAVCKKFERLRTASEEADGLTKNEGKVLALIAGSLFSLCGQGRHWQSGHECLFAVARIMAADFRDGAKPQDSLENHFLRRTIADWPKLFAQLQRERMLAESATEISLQPIALIKEVQRVQQREPLPLNGIIPGASPTERKHKAAQAAAAKAVETKAVKKEEQAILRTDAINAARIPPAPSAEAQLTWKIHQEDKSRTQQEIAGIMSNRLGYSVNQQWVSDRLRDCSKWFKKTGLSEDDLENLPGGKELLMSPASIDLRKGQERPASAQQQKAMLIQEGSDDAGWNQDVERVTPDEGIDDAGDGPASSK